MVFLSQKKQRAEETVIPYKYCLKLPAAFSPFSGCRLEVVPLSERPTSSEDRGSKAAITCRVTKVLPGDQKVSVRCGDGSELEVRWDRRRDQVKGHLIENTLELGDNSKIVARQEVALGETKDLDPLSAQGIANVLFSDSEDESDISIPPPPDNNNNSSNSSDVAISGTVVDAVNDIWDLLNSCGVVTSPQEKEDKEQGRNDHCEYESDSEAKHTAILESEEYFQRAHKSKKVRCRLVPSEEDRSQLGKRLDIYLLQHFFQSFCVAYCVLPIIASSTPEVPTDTCIVGQCIKVRSRICL